ncbi:MAG: hypothetical protein AAGB19_07705, partial [Cyanobacteria bacterium P01_F01_bin.3]
LNLWGMHSAFCQPMNRFEVISVIIGTNRRLQNIEQRCANGSKVGERPTDRLCHPSQNRVR